MKKYIILMVVGMLLVLIGAIIKIFKISVIYDDLIVIIGLSFELLAFVSILKKKKNV